MYYITLVLACLHWLPIQASVDFKALLLTYKDVHRLNPRVSSHPIGTWRWMRVKNICKCKTEYRFVCSKPDFQKHRNDCMFEIWSWKRRKDLYHQNPIFKTPEKICGLAPWNFVSSLFATLYFVHIYDRVSMGAHFRQ